MLLSHSLYLLSIISLSTRFFAWDPYTVYIRVMCYRMSHNSKHHLTGRTSLGIKTGYLANITIQFRILTVIIAIILRIQMVCKHSAARRQQRIENKKSEKKRKKESEKRNETMILSIEQAHLQLIEENSQRILHSIFWV